MELRNRIISRLENNFLDFMIIQSKYRKLFLVKILFACFIFFLVLFLNLKFLYENLFNFKDTFFVLAVFLLILIIRLSFEVLNIYSLKVSEKDISHTILVTQKTTNFSYDQITGINREKVAGQQTGRGQISAGFFRTVIIFNDGSKLIVSPDDFENYQELLMVIKNNLDNYKANVSVYKNI
jgi:hypothetical protein